MPEFIKLDDNTYVIPQTVMAVQARLTTDLKGTVVVTTAGGAVLVPSNNVPVDLERIRDLVAEGIKPVVGQGPQTLLG